MKKVKNELNSSEIKDLLRYFIDNNVTLAKEGKTPISIEIEGLPGTAKTSVAKQVAGEFGHHYVRLNVSEIEVPDLIGLPTYEYKITNKAGEVMWVTDKVLAHYVANGWTASGDNRTSYSRPSWIHGKEDKPIILVLDDYNRCTPMMANACMTLIDEQKYISWALPEGSTIILTCNPSDQDFMVQSEDSAQATRRLKVHMKADVNIWASEFAEAYGVDGRCINFMLKHPEIIEGTGPSHSKDGDVMAKGNLRIWTKYFDSISGIKDFSKDIGLVMNLGNGSLPQEHIVMFANFIKNGLDKLPSPDELLKKDIKWSIQALKDNIKEGKDKRQDIAAILTKRLLNYAIVNEKDFSKEMIENYAEMLESGFLSSDLILLSLRKLVGLSKFKTLIIKHPKLQKMLIS